MKILFLCLAIAASQFSKPSFANPIAEHVILISCDGMRPDAIVSLGPEKAPNLHRIRREGAITDNARTDPDSTTTLQNHSSMITGRGVQGDAGHQWTDNGNPKIGQNLHRNRGFYIYSVFDAAHDFGRKTALLASKPKFSIFDWSYDEGRGKADPIAPDNGKDKIDVFLASTSAERALKTMLEMLESDSPPHFTLLHFVNPDAAGHRSGWNLSSTSTEYMRSISTVDGYIGKVMAAVEASPRLRNSTTIIVTADHGGKTGTKGHEQSSVMENYRIPFYVWGQGTTSGGAELYRLNRDTRRDPGQENPDFDSGLQPIRSGGAGNLALSLLGLPPIPGSTINSRHDLKIGRPMDLSQATAGGPGNPNGEAGSLPTISVNPETPPQSGTVRWKKRIRAIPIGQ
ncbi:MAG: alkaline phosphatase family protein [Verrucomicrobiota bacterium]